MDRLLQNSSIEIDKKLIACENAFHISLSSEKNPIKNNVSDDPKLLQSIKSIRNCGLEQVAIGWLLNQLDQEIKPPTSKQNNDFFMTEIKERSKLWSCLAKICSWYPSTAEKTFLIAKQQPCEFIAKSISEGTDVNTSEETKWKILQWISQFLLTSEKVSCAMFRQPLTYNQIIAKLITISQKEPMNNESNKQLNFEFILEHYKKFLKQIHDNVNDGGNIDVDSIEGNFLEVILPVIIDESTNTTMSEEISEIIYIILFQREQLVSDWKDFMYSLTVADRKPSTNTDHIEKLLYFLRQNTKDNNRVIKSLPILFNAVLKIASNRNENQEGINVVTKFTHKEIVLFFVMCSYILKIGPLSSSLPSQIILDNSLAACKISDLMDEKSQKEERLLVFGNLITLLSNSTPTSSIVSVEFNTNKDDNLENSMQFIMWLKLTLKDTLEARKQDYMGNCCLNYSSFVIVVTSLMKLDSRIVESLIGPILGNVLFKKMGQCPKISTSSQNSDETDIPPLLESMQDMTCQIAKTQFITDLFSTYSRLRQIPKLIAKFFLCLQYKEDQAAAKTYPFSSIDVMNPTHLGICGRYLNKLPYAQLMEVFKTFLYHLESIESSLVKASLLSQKDLKSEYYVAILNLSNILIPCFLKNSSVSDHLVPISTKEKYIQLMIKMHEIIKSKFDSHFELVKSVLVSLSQVASLMMSYDTFEGREELKSGLRSIVTEAEIFHDDVKLLSPTKRKLSNVDTKEKKRKKRALRNTEKSITNGDLILLQNDVMENIDKYTDEDYYRISKIIWTCVHSDENLFSTDFEFSTWIKTLVSENVGLQNALLLTTIEAFSCYFKDDNSIPKKIKNAFQNLDCQKFEIVGVKGSEVILQAAQTMSDLSLDVLESMIGEDVPLKTEDVVSFTKVFGQLLPLELIHGNSESTTSLFLSLMLIIAPSTKNIAFQKTVVACLLRCWDTTYRTTNILRYLPFGKYIRMVCRLEINLSLNRENESNSKVFDNMFSEKVPLTFQLSKIGVSLQSHGENANVLLDLNDGTLNTICDAASVFYSTKCDNVLVISDAMCSIALMKSIATFVTAPGQSNRLSSKTMLDDKNRNLTYFASLGEKFLLGLKHIKLNYEDIVSRSIVTNHSSSKTFGEYDKIVAVLSGVSSTLALTSRLPTLDISPIEDILMNLVKLALIFVSSTLEQTLKHDHPTVVGNVNQCFDFLEATCKHVALCPTDNEENTQVVKIICKSFLDSKVIQSSNIRTKSDSSIKIEICQNELFETILRTFKNKDIFKDIVTALIERLETELYSTGSFNEFQRVMNLLGYLATISLDAESDKNYEFRQIALEKAIQLIQVNK